MKLKTVQTTCLLGTKQDKWKRSKAQQQTLSDSAWYQAVRAMAPNGWLRDRLIENIRRCAELQVWPTGNCTVGDPGRAPTGNWSIDLLRGRLNLEVTSGATTATHSIFLANPYWCYTVAQEISNACDVLYRAMRGDSRA